MFALHWGAKLKYMFLSIDESVVSCGLGAAGASVSNFCWNHHSKGVHTGKLGVNYHF
jgi:hypothetical protein